jgi:hypothetical protein
MQVHKRAPPKYLTMLKRGLLLVITLAASTLNYIIYIEMKQFSKYHFSKEKNFFFFGSKLIYLNIYVYINFKIFFFFLDLESSNLINFSFIDMC